MKTGAKRSGATSDAYPYEAAVLPRSSHRSPRSSARREQGRRTEGAENGAGQNGRRGLRDVEQQERGGKAGVNRKDEGEKDQTVVALALLEDVKRVAERRQDLVPDLAGQ